MARNLPATVLGMIAGATVSIGSGALLGSYVVTGIAPAYAAPVPPRISAEPALADAETWPPADPMAAVQGFGDDQATGERSSGSSRL